MSQDQGDGLGLFAFQEARQLLWVRFLQRVQLTGAELLRACHLLHQGIRAFLPKGLDQQGAGIAVASLGQVFLGEG